MTACWSTAFGKKCHRRCTGPLVWVAWGDNTLAIFHMNVRTIFVQAGQDIWHGIMVVVIDTQHFLHLTNEKNPLHNQWFVLGRSWSFSQARHLPLTWQTRNIYALGPDHWERTYTTADALVARIASADFLNSGANHATMQASRNSSQELSEKYSYPKTTCTCMKSIWLDGNPYGLGGKLHKLVTHWTP